MKILPHLSPTRVDDAVVWYEQQAEGLSRNFLDQLDRAVRLVKSHPRIATEIEPEIRRFLFSRFPYSRIYSIDDQTIVVIAVAHQHREPRYWADRVDSMRE